MQDFTMHVQSFFSVSFFFFRKNKEEKAEKRSIKQSNGYGNINACIIFNAISDVGHCNNIEK